MNIKIITLVIVVTFFVTTIVTYVIAINACAVESIETSFIGTLQNGIFGTLGFEFGVSRAEKSPTEDFADLSEVVK